MPPDEPNDEERLEELPEDNGTPFSVPEENVHSTGADGREHAHPALDSTHPATDTNLIPEEFYDEGISGAAEAIEPNAGDTVVSYDQKKDGRKKQSDSGAIDEEELAP